MIVIGADTKHGGRIFIHWGFRLICHKSLNAFNLFKRLLRF
jgi:hypothetical protein